VLDHELVNEWIKSKDDHAFAMTRRLIRSAGLLCGGSSGTAVEAGIRWLNETETGRKIAATEGANVVFILPDS
jgi:cystathionine beta-synthase